VKIIVTLRILAPFRPETVKINVTP